VGTSDGGASIKARSYLNFSTPAIRGKPIMSASLSLYEFHSYGCTAKTIFALQGSLEGSRGRTSSITNWATNPATALHHHQGLHWGHSREAWPSGGRWEPAGALSASGR